MHFSRTNSIGLGKGTKSIRRYDDDNDSNSSSSPSSSAENENNHYKDLDRNRLSLSESSSSTYSSSESPIVSESSTEYEEDHEDINAPNRNAAMNFRGHAFSTMNSLNNGNHSNFAPHSVNSTSSLATNFTPTTYHPRVFNDNLANQRIERTDSNLSLILTSDVRRKLPHEPDFHTSTPKKHCPGIDQQTNINNKAVPFNPRPTSSSLTASTATQIVPPKRENMNNGPPSSLNVSSVTRNLSWSAPKTFDTLITSSQQGNQGNPSSLPAIFPNCDIPLLVQAVEIQEAKPSILSISSGSFVLEFIDSTQDLTVEVLVEIFKKLPLSDRKNVRLVCKDWFDACSTFEAEENICIRHFYNLHLNEVLSTLCKSRRRCINLEFRGLDFERKPRVTFWKICGPKVLSLRLADCQISSQPFASILRYCRNLRTLEFDFHRLQDLKYGVRVISPTRTIPIDLLNRSLRTLKINFDVYQSFNPCTYWLEYICQFFRLFPNISNFTFCHRNLWQKGMVVDPSSIDSAWSENALGGDYIHQLQTSINRFFVRSRMESITINFLYYPGFGWKSLSFVQGLTKIVELAVHFHEDLNLEAFSNFVHQQVNLKNVTFYSDGKDFNNEKLSHFVPLVLKKTCLREFNLFLYNVAIKWHYDWSILLSTSNVETLRIACIEMDCTSLLPPGNSYPLNSNLKKLAIQVETMNEMNDVILILDAFHKLKELRLNRANNEIMNSLLRRQNKIESLSVNSTSATIISCQLAQLKKLEIPETVALEGKCFHNLKYLRVLRPADLQPEDKDFIPRNYLNIGNLQTYRFLCPSLEVLWIDCFLSKWFCHKNETFFEIVRGLLNKMKNLKFFYLAQSMHMIHTYRPRLTEEEVSEIFLLYPSLEVFIYGATFIRDVIENRIRKLENVIGRCPANEFLRKYVNVDQEWDYGYVP